MKKLILFFSVILFISCNDSSDGNASNADHVQGKGGSLATFTLNSYSGQTYLYTVDYDGLRVFDLKNEKDPIQVNRVPVTFDVETLFSYKQYLYVGSQSGMYIYDASQPEEPKEVGRATHFTACDPVVANDSLAFVTLSSDRMCGNNINELQIYNIKDVTEPVLISVRGLVQPRGLALYGNYLFVCDDEVKIFDVSKPEETKFLKSIKRNAFDIVIHNDIMMLIGKEGLYQYQINNSTINEITHLSDFNFSS